MALTPRMAVWGTLMMGLKLSMPKPPRLETVKVAPCSRSGLILPSMAWAASSLLTSENSFRLIWEAPKTVGTSSPRGVSQAKPMWTTS